MAKKPERAVYAFRRRGNTLVPDMDFDLDILKGMDVKTIWVEDGDYDNLELIMPLGAKVKPHPVEPVDDEPPPEMAADSGEGIPF